MTDKFFFLFFFFFPLLWNVISVHRVTQSGVSVAVNWWFDMTIGKDYVYQQACYSLRRLIPAGVSEANGSDAESGENGHYWERSTWNCKLRTK